MDDEVIDYEGITHSAITDGDNPEPFCDWDHQDWPCPTVRSIRADQQPRITEGEAIARLDAIDSLDSEADHLAADRVLLAFVPYDVLSAWRRVEARSGFWYS